MSKGCILMIEDNPGIMGNNGELLRLEGYRTLEAYTLEEGKALAIKENPDLILLDILLPDGNGLDYCRELRRASGVRILFLSAMNTKEDTIAGLRAGGDDYIAKPYMNEELLARIEALLRRSSYGEKEEILLCLGALKIDYHARRAYLNDKDILLKPKEFAVLEYLARRRYKHIPASELYEKIWGMGTAGDMRTVWEHISRIRNKMGDKSFIDIESQRGEGYKLIIK